MDSVQLGDDLRSSRLVYGCMRMCGDGSAAAQRAGLAALDAAYDSGIRHFDHADIYAAGEAERLFGTWLRANPGVRDELVITSKCGIRLAAADSVQHYDLSPRHIEQAVSGSISRLGIDRLDILLLHRPDYLMQPAAIGTMFDALYQRGHVRAFGVSNFSASQLRLLATTLGRPLRLNQIEFSLAATSALDNGDLDACMEQGVTAQAWSPLAGAIASHHRTRPHDTKNDALRAELDLQATAYGVVPWQIALAWVLRHPSGILPIIGSVTPSRIALAVEATAIDYARVDWYRLFEARNGRPVP